MWSKSPGTTRGFLFVLGVHCLGGGTSGSPTRIFARILMGFSLSSLISSNQEAHTKRLMTQLKADNENSESTRHAINAIHGRNDRSKAPDTGRHL